jgi:hypothetical protein
VERARDIEIRGIDDGGCVGGKVAEHIHPHVAWKPEAELEHLPQLCTPLFLPDWL